MVVVRPSVVMNMPRTGERGAFALKLDSDSICAETPRVLRPIVVPRLPRQHDSHERHAGRANISISTMTTPMRTSRGPHRNASPSESADQGVDVPVPQNLEERFEESTQELIIEQIGDQIVDVPVPQIMPEIIEVRAPAPVIEYAAPALAGEVPSPLEASPCKTRVLFLG